jgi:hypothetical protein
MKTFTYWVRLSVFLFSFLFLPFTPVFAQSTAPTIQNMSLENDPTNISQYQKVEWRFDLSKTYTNPYYYYDPNDTNNPSNMTWSGVDGITVDLHLTAPSGKQITLPAFWYVDYARTKDGDVEALGKKDNGHWRARFAPAEVGEYRYYFTAEDKTGNTRTALHGQSFQCKRIYSN